MVLMGKRGIDGNSPIAYSVQQGGGLEVINNPLGSGVLEDEDGNITSDDNKQVGSIGINLNGVSAEVEDDFAILTCEVSVAKISGTIKDANELNLYQSQSPTSTVTLNAIKASDGTALSSATLTLKKKNSSGSSVTVSNNSATVVAGDTYYYSVALTNYTTATGTFVANAGNNVLIVPLVAS